MADYLTLADAKKHLSRIINIIDNDDDYLTELIEECEGMINSAIGSRYTIPITSAQAINFVNSLIVPILRFKAFCAFNEQEDFPEGVKEEYKATMKTLENLAKQVISLPSEDEKTTGRPSYIKIHSPTSSISDY